MDQQIGIAFMPTGEEKVFQVIDKLSMKIEQFVASASGLGTMLNTINEATSKLTGMGTQFSQNMGGMTKSVKDFGKESKTAIGDVTKSMKDMGGMVGPGGKGPKGTKFGADMGLGGMGMLGPSMFMLRWKFYTELLKGMHEYATGVLMGQSREKIMPEMRDISVIGFNKKERDYTEKQSQGFMRRWYATGTQKDYLASVAEAGSAWEVNDPMFKGKGAEALNKMSQYGMILAGSAKAKGEQMQKLLQGLVHARMMFMPEEERNQYTSGEKPITGLAEASAGKVAEIIKLSPEWGKEVDYLMQYALPSAMQKGWSMERLLAMGGAMSLAGFKGQKTGRGLKMFLEGQSGWLAALQAAGNEDPRVAAQYKEMKPAEQKMFRTDWSNVIEKRMKTDTYGLLADIGKWGKLAEERGFNPVQALGAPSQWIGHVRAMGTPAFIEAMKKYEEMLKGIEDLSGAETAISDQQADPGYWMKRLKQEWQFMEQNWSKALAESGQTQPIFERISATIQRFNEYLGGTASGAEAMTEAMKTGATTAGFAMTKLGDLFQDYASGLVNLYSTGLAKLGLLKEPLNVDIRGNLSQGLSKMYPEGLLSSMGTAAKFARDDIGGTIAGLAESPNRVALEAERAGEGNSALSALGSLGTWITETLQGMEAGAKRAAEGPDTGRPEGKEPIVIHTHLDVEGHRLADAVNVINRDSAAAAGQVYGSTLGVY